MPNPYYEDKWVKIFHGDCREILPSLDVKVDLVLTDPPYGITACKWDSIVPLDVLWKLYGQVIKAQCPIIMFGNEPFSSQVRISNIDWYKYDWKWDKIRGVGHLNSKIRPMMCIEDIMVFYKNACTYNPQMRDRVKPRVSQNKATQEVYGKSQDDFVGNSLDKKFPINLISFSKSAQTDMLHHPTQKPVALIEYLINTYTNENDSIIDPFLGSGTTCYCAKKLNRYSIGIELSEKYCEIAAKRCSQEVMELSL
jgi:DNA modification methylase